MKLIRIMVASIAMGGLFAIASQGQDYDLIIKNGRIIDGTGNPSYHADVGVRSGRIARIGRLDGGAATVIDARQMIVAPGFIDVHTHIESRILELPEAENFVRMGVTTVVTGNCGGSAQDIGDFLRRIAEKRASINVATLIGHGTVRRAVMQTENRAPTGSELEAMKKLVAKGMEDGAVGLSTGLIYVPGTYAKTEEIIELAKVASQYQGVYATHMRDEGNDILEAIREAIRIGKEAKLPVQISHFKVSSKKKWGESKNALRTVEQARAQGIDVTLDQYAYTASSTNLGVLLPSWALAGGADKLRGRLNDKAERERIKNEIVRKLKDGGWKDFSFAYVARYEADPSLNGKNLKEITKLKRGHARLNDQVEQILEMMLQGGASMIYHRMHERDVERIMKHPLTMIASDGGIQRMGDGVPHPRSYGNNARVLGEYVRNRRLITLEDAIRKMTSLPAQTFKLKDRGLVKEGMWADIVVFDERKITDRATFQNPHQYAEGVAYVLVNGVPVVSEGAHTRQRPGQIIYGPGKR